MICSPMSVWRLMNSHCSSFSGPGLDHAPVRRLHPARQQHAKRVPAEPVAGPVPSHGSCEAMAEAGEQRIARDVAEGVVVLLEAVEVAEPKECRLIFACRLAHPG